MKFRKQNKIWIVLVSIACLSIAQLELNAQWIQQIPPVSTNLYDVQFLNDNVGYVAGSNGTILKTLNGGLDWTELNSGRVDPIFDLYFIDENIGWATGNLGNSSEQQIILKTTDAGNSWTEIVVSFGSLVQYNNLYFIDENIGWIMDSEGRIYQSTDGGTDWFSLGRITFNSVDESPIDVYYFDSNTWLASITSGGILKTTNAGFTWQRVSISTSSDYGAITFIDALTGWTIGNIDGVAFIEKSSDGGNTWIEQLSSVSNFLYSIDFVDQNFGWAVGEFGVIFKTSNGGSTWVDESSPPNQALLAVHFPSIRNGWAVGQEGTILKRNSLFTEQANINIREVDESAVDWGDYDNDGDLDLFITGSWDGNISEIYENVDGEFFADTLNNFVGVRGGSVDWGDYDNDGDLDILITGLDDNFSEQTKVYENNGDKTFFEPPFANSNLPDVWQSNAVWGDYDNDGDLDILLSGVQIESFITDIYRNENGFSFTPILAGLTEVTASSSAWGDYDNDGDLDVLLTGESLAGPITRIYRNDGDDIFTSVADLVGIFDGSCAWGDYDSDGDLDILLTGYNESFFPSFYIYRNDNNDIFVFLEGLTIIGVGSSSGAWGDYDNDGDLDIIITGEIGDGVRYTGLYRNDGIVFTEQLEIQLTGVRNGNATWADYDNDNDLDLLLTGNTNLGAITKIYRNESSLANTIPSLPINLQSVVLNSSVSLSWGKSNDNETSQNGLGYNIVIGSSPNDVDVVSPMTDRISGYRKVVEMGNTNSNNSWTINSLADGFYNWSVQAIDNNFAGSQFAAEETFYVGPLFPIPTITSIFPLNRVIGDPEFIMSITGIDFVEGAVVRFDGGDRLTTFIDPTRLTAQILASDLLQLGNHDITVFNPEPGGGESDPQIFTVNNPFPGPITISPTSVIEGSPGFSLIVNGSRFINNSIVRFEGSERQTTFVSSTQLTAQLLASDLLTPGNYDITVFNPAPGGGESTIATFTVVGVTDPQIISISPTSAFAGGPTFNLTINGNNFLNESIVRFDGIDKTTTFQNPTQLSTQILASDISDVGIFEITVFNPPPNNVVSNPISFTVDSVASPFIALISPMFYQVSDLEITINIFGQNFINESIVQFNDLNRPTTFISATELSADLLAGDFSIEDTNAVRVFNPPTSYSNTVELITFVYPATTVLQSSYNFGDFGSTSSYRQIGLPGDNDLPLADFMVGEFGSSNDWLGYWDSGSGNYIEYDGSPTFNFTPGKAFWILSKNNINIDGEIINVELDGDNNYSIPLHDEWNLISNPFNRIVPWVFVQIENAGITEPIYYFSSGGYIEPNPILFSPYLGYYYFNNPAFGMTSLKIPYIFPSSILPKYKKQTLSDKIELSLTSGGIKKSSILIGFDQAAEQGLDKLEKFAPPSNFSVMNVSLYNNALETNYKYLKEEYRPEIGEGQEYKIVIKNENKDNLELETYGIESFSEYELILVDERLNKVFDLKQNSKFVLSKLHKLNNYKLLIGNIDFIDSKIRGILPTEYSLYQNYPNPFNPTTVLRFSLPEVNQVNLVIFNSLGEKVETILSNQLFEAGYHEIEFNAANFSSGVYIYRISIGGFVNSKKMIFLK